MHKKVGCLLFIRWMVTYCAQETTIYGNEFTNYIYFWENPNDFSF